MLGTDKRKHNASIFRRHNRNFTITIAKLSLWVTYRCQFFAVIRNVIVL